MPDPLPIPTQAAEFHQLFQGHPEIHGTSRLTGEVKNDGKLEAKSFAVHEPLDQGKWERHIKGEVSIGCFPLRPDGTVRWSALDIDIYGDATLVPDVLAKIADNSLPLVPCTSKSGGLHLYCFFSENTPAKDAVRILKELSAFLGHGTCEIFPKQERLGTQDSDAQYGNWMNMPYDGPMTQRYALDTNSAAFPPMELDDFIQRTKDKSLSAEQAKTYTAPQSDQQLLPEGPPCLNHIFEKEAWITGGRNEVLFSVGVYLKKKGVENFEEEIIRYNNMFDEPLEEGELKKTVLKSTQKKSYRYKCGKQPICRFCNSKLCAKQKYGIDEEESLVDPDNRTLIKINSDPVTWYLTIDGVDVPLSTMELSNNHAFNQKVMEVTLQHPYPMEADDWLQYKRRWLASCTVVDIPEEATPFGQLKEMLWEYARSATEDEDAFMTAKKFIDREKQLLYFKPTDLKDFLERMRFHNTMKPNQVQVSLKKNLGVYSTKIRVNKAQVRCAVLDVSQLNDAVEPPSAEILEPPC